MSDSAHSEHDFISQVTAVTMANLSNEQFGVTELADEMNMSRSNLLRKVKKLTNLSASQFINQVRLNKSMELLQKSSLNVSEVSNQVGFNSTSYFIKCFRELYGYPPGEVGKRNDSSQQPEATIAIPRNSRIKVVWLVSVGLAIIVAMALFYYFRSHVTSSSVERSIVVLPFKNESNDSTNIYLINGLMESTLSNLQKIKDLKVISRTSAEKYRNTSRTIPEMAKELNVNYFVEGSGQKIGDKILLNIQLIDGNSDKHLWAKQYRREVKDIFQLQQEIAQNIAEEIQAIITPEEEKRIKQKPTDNLLAYDWFLKANHVAYDGSEKNMLLAAKYHTKAIELDPKFALAYAHLAFIYYYLDIFHTEKKYEAELNNNADKALLYDSKLPESLVAKAMFYMERKEYTLAVPHLEKALEYNPNSALVIQFLADLYNIYIPNAPRYLEYALQGLRLDAAANDSVTMSYTYLHLGNAFIQTGFIDESLMYLDKSLQYNPKNPFTGYLKIFVVYAKDRDMPKAARMLVEEYNKDTTRIDILMQVGEMAYQMHDDESAYRYFSKLVAMRENLKLDLFRNEDLKIGLILDRHGRHDEAKKFIASFKDYADHDRSIYKQLYLAMYEAYLNDSYKAIEQLKLFSKEDNFQYWFLLLRDEPLVSKIKDLPEFKKVMQGMEIKFWDQHNEIKKSLKEKGLL